MKKYDCIIVEGDSYSARSEQHMVYSDFLSSISNHNHILNYAVSGSSNKRIFRSALERVQDAKKNYQHILCIVAYSFLNRKEVWYLDSNPNVLQKTYGSIHSKMVTATWINDYDQQNYKKYMALEDFDNTHLHLTHFYDELYMFYNTLENIGCDYFILSGADNSDQYYKRNKQYIDDLQSFQKCKQNKNIIDMANFSISNFAIENKINSDSTGHLTQKGHKIFAEYIRDELNL